MKGKVGIVVGLAAGYVLGARAGRERYEQIASGVQKLWNTKPVQKQVANVKDATKTAALAVPSAVWDGAVKITKAASSKSSHAASDIAKGAEATASAVKKAADDAVSDAKKASDH